MRDRVYFLARNSSSLRVLTLLLSAGTAGQRANRGAHRRSASFLHLHRRVSCQLKGSPLALAVAAELNQRGEGVLPAGTRTHTHACLRYNYRSSLSLGLILRHDSLLPA